MNAKPIRWIIPPVLGFAAYLLSAEQDGAAGGDAVQAAETRRGTGTRTDAGVAVEEFQQEWAARKKEVEAQTLALSNEALREKILVLRKAFLALGDNAEWGETEQLHRLLGDAVRELGKREGAAALAWAVEISPELRVWVMEGWAKGDPEGAFQAVIQSEKLAPCSDWTLVELLKGKAAAGDAVLAQACRDVPWELFLDSRSDPFADGMLNLSQDEIEDARPWIESGAARQLAEEGILIGGLFTKWSEMDARGAMENVLDWPGGREADMLLVLGPGLKDQGKLDELRGLLEELPPEQLERFSAALEGPALRNARGFVSGLRKGFPILVREKEVAE
ncbi:hypothetical protein OJ996_22145 [Luteolibacter sp. GHJ8]|uniref:HEAT repeat protein n=1 Tax=Luteolibacter rhizosphaerae TaxID=2989719 RepID=A0ABT3G9I6_9BACT|nr:hypothetical protein [Luteolibacter rhizosphaerae]MCW1916307.1 hypothetical protein [Luteolibacter rhizosphaerae]